MTERLRLLSCLLYGLLYELKKKKIIWAEVVILHLAMRVFTDSFVISNPEDKTQYTVVSELHHWKTHFFTWKMIVTASKRYFSRLVPQLDGVFFPSFVGKLQGQKVLQNSPNKRWKKMLMLQNELLRMTWSSCSLSTICLRLLHFERFIDELFKPCERLKLPVVIKNCCRGPRETARLFMSNDPGSCSTLACVKARPENY